MALFNADGKSITPEGMTLAEYAALYNAISHMSVDIEDCVPRFGDDDWDEVSAAKYALVKGMIDCITDVPNSKLEFYTKRGMTLPEVDIDFSGDTPRLTVGGEYVE